MLHAVIMAGGSGTRFWPESRDLRPKQLLNLSGEGSMLQQTVARLGRLVPADRVLIATGARLAQAVAQQLPQLPPPAILAEPCKRDTAACIGLAALVVSRTDPDATMAVMPSDHVIGPDEHFQQALAGAAQLVEERPARLVTFGIKPTYPAESFGYIERGQPLESAAGQPAAFQVARFREKPQAAVAAEYLASGKFYWNSGIFVWKARTILAELEQRQPEMCARLRTIAAAWGTPSATEVFAREFEQIKGVSIDYAVMEHAQDVVVIEAPYRWDDLGSWQALARLHGQDEHGNTIIGQHLGVRTSGTIVRGPAEHLIVTLGIKDCVVVHTPDATLVANKHEEEAIREVVKLLQERGLKHLL